MLKSALNYASERSPLPFVILLGLALFLSGLQALPIDSWLFLKGWLSMSLFLFLIRLSDDICDIPIDRITHPERGLCSGTISLKKMNNCRLVLIATLLFLQLGHTQAMIFMVSTLVFFFLFFAIKPRLPVLIHISLLNLSLFIFPVYAGLFLLGKVTIFQLLMGVFFWLGGIGHDLSHGLIDTMGLDKRLLNPVNRLNQRFLAVLSLVCFILSALIGVLVINLQAMGSGFSISLLVMCVIILWFEYFLIRSPCEATAKPFYILGFIFFLLPPLTHVAELIVTYLTG